jgi:hypothetical protein
MACNTPGCSDAAAAGSGANVVYTPKATCSGATFCDSKLEGLPFAPGLDLVGVPEGDQCLHRLGAAKGVWQHDPDRPGGSDFAGPLANGLAFQPGEKMGTDECGHVPMLRDVSVAGGPPTLEVVAQDVAVKSSGELTLTTVCKGGKVRTDVLEPEPYDDANPCEANISFLGFVRQIVIEGGKQVTRKVWKAVTRFVLPDAQISKFTGVDLTDGNSWRKLVAKKRGDCWEVGLDAPETAVVDDCSLLPSVGSTFAYLLACDGGVHKKIEPQSGKTLVGNGSTWELKVLGLTRPTSGIRHFIGQKFTGNTSTLGDIPGRVDLIGVTSGQTTGTFDMTDIPGYTAGRSTVWVRATAHAGIGGSGLEALAQVYANGEVICEAWVDDANDFAYKDSVVYPVKLTNDSFGFNLNTYTNAVPGCQAQARLEVVGWD